MFALRAPSTSSVEVYDVIREVLVHDNFDIHFQPIVSLKKQACIGMEALARFSHPDLRRRVPPSEVFQWARIHNKLFELDRACRIKAVNTFAQSFGDARDLLLFLNFETTLLDEEGDRSNCILENVLAAGLRPESVVIEINESEVHDKAGLLRFVNHYRKQGFLIAVDDVGKAHSSLERIAIAKPDILKLDRSLFVGIARDFYRQQIYRAVVSLGQRIGALVLSEAIETQEEVAMNILLGVDLLQGYFFSEPRDVAQLQIPEILQRMHATTEHCYQMSQEKMVARQRSSQAFQAFKGRVMELLEAEPNADLGEVVRRFDQIPAAIECFYLLNLQGIQTSETVLCQKAEVTRRHANMLFQPATPGTDHRMKEYYYGLMAIDKTTFVTDPYISLATGSLCRTFSSRFAPQSGRSGVLCMDITHDLQW